MPEDPLPLTGRYLVYPAVNVWLQQFRSKMNVRSSKRQVRQTPVWGHGYSYLDPQKGEQNNRPFYRMIQQRITASCHQPRRQFDVKAPCHWRSRKGPR